MIQVDMSEYMEKHSVSRLVGSPPGYIGYDEGGQLTEAVRRKPYSVLLLDEIEKAHPDVFNILLQILEEGKLTDAQGRRVDFRNTIIVMTSNIGAGQISKNQSLGFTMGDDTGMSYDDMKNKVMGELKKVFRPELLNRIDEVIVFHKLTKEEILTIVDIQMKRVREQMATHEVAIELTDEAKELLVEKGYDPAMGARPLRRAIQRVIEDPLADFVLGRSLEPRLDDPRRPQGRDGRGRHDLHPGRGHAREDHRPARAAAGRCGRARTRRGIASARAGTARSRLGRVRYTVGVTLSRRLAFVVFFAGAGTLAIEIAASRLLAPYFGSSTVVWANIIGLTLGYLALGYWLGGRLADRRPEPRLLARILLLAAAALAITPFAARPILDVAVRGLDALSLGVGGRLVLRCARALRGAGHRAGCCGTVRVAPRVVERRGRRQGRRQAVCAVDGRQPRWNLRRGARRDSVHRHAAHDHRNCGDARLCRCAHGRAALVRRAGRRRSAARASGRPCEAQPL